MFHSVPKLAEAVEGSEYFILFYDISLCFPARSSLKECCYLVLHTANAVNYILHNVRTENSPSDADPDIHLREA